ncbi:flagellar basal body P-ring formation chaperone FlgA [bacterium]|jgi:flagella basal body P-ring formation protein FlgA|nr:flagellar basal body P-ring formation chaperone FlgA [bacterium]
MRLFLHRLAQLISPIIGAIAVFSPASANTVVTGLDIKSAILERLAHEDIMAVPKVADHRRYYKCDQTLLVEAKYPGKWDTVTVTCPNQDVALAWSVMIRVVDASLGFRENSQPDANNSPKVVVLLASVKKGEVLTPDIMTLIPAPRGSRIGSFYRVEDVVGRRTTQALSAMQPLRARNLEFDWALTTGQPVQIVQRISGLEISTIGEALDNAQIGDITDVRNIKSGKIIAVRVKSSRKVTPIANIN